MTINVDKDLIEWFDDDVSIDEDIKLKDGAPEAIKKKFEEYKKKRTDYNASWKGLTNK
jgi:hypothetical protein